MTVKCDPSINNLIAPSKKRMKGHAGKCVFWLIFTIIILILHLDGDSQYYGVAVGAAFTWLHAMEALRLYFQRHKVFGFYKEYAYPLPVCPGCGDPYVTSDDPLDFYCKNCRSENSYRFHVENYS